MEKLDGLVITKVHSASVLYSPAGTKSRRDDRTYSAVVLKFEGETVYRYHGRSITSDINHPVILPKGSSYEWECTREGKFIIIEFDGEIPLGEPLSFYLKRSDKLLETMLGIEEKRNKKVDFYEIESIKDTYSAILTLLSSKRETYHPKNKYNIIAPAVEYIKVNFDKPLSNDLLAKLSGVSTVYFRKLFTEIIGVSPISYARELRIEKAKEILMSDYGTLGDLALLLGYSSLYDFSRDFKKHTGVSPSGFALKG